MNGEQLEILGAILMLYGIFEWFNSTKNVWRGMLVLLSVYTAWMGFFIYKAGFTPASIVFGVVAYAFMARFLMLWCAEMLYTNDDPDDLI